MAEPSLTEARLLRMPEKDYMNTQQREFFRQRLLELKRETQESIEAIKQDIAHGERESDELDRAHAEEENRQRMRIAERHYFLLRKIDKSLLRIAEGSYGYCEITGDAIGLQRLLLRPTAELCAEEKARQELLERNFSQQRH
jgi:DnaK suppressor protein